MPVHIRLDSTCEENVTTLGLPIALSELVPRLFSS